jgi:diketogulonate reductase-like aldo/keto reductase
MRGAACTAAVRAAIAAGYRHIDTAAMYGNEEAVGEGIRGGGVARDEIFITTKVWPDSIRAGSLQRSAEGSVRRLGLSEVDLLLIHWPNPDVPLEESIGALNDARSRGLTRHIGVSNFDIGLMHRAIALSPAPIVANQVEHHPLRNQSALLDACRAAGVVLVSYSPLAKKEVLGASALRQIAERHRKTPAQIILRWHIQLGCVAIPKSEDPKRIRENIDIFDFDLSPSELAAVSGLSTGP